MKIKKAIFTGIGIYIGVVALAAIFEKKRQDKEFNDIIDKLYNDAYEQLDRERRNLGFYTEEEKRNFIDVTFCK